MTSRLAIAEDLPDLPLVVIDEVHNLKNENVQARKHWRPAFGPRLSNAGLSATPFQLRQAELLSILKLRNTLTLSRERRDTWMLRCRNWPRQ